ncbi:iron complex transport system permease protein [Kineosphaera limosa]|uniref:Putative ABC transporter permease protein n=1 Tax=Kineosphaera limosa NBRC 100340 TaxID=1184609 RepID=K6X814_9MICO|nr:iron chelate uptake ABC transporter family permease subunit [Kineosphaera limosa]NYE00585.1 iron complex transport system permease protein [Kineosphaera limosa]GAB94949.1 putative ABC transporter permease protein [Kineosphaera limosa NBRC 100340]
MLHPAAPRSSATGVRIVLVGALCVAILGSAVLALGVGSVNLSAAEVLQVVARRMHLSAGAEVTVIADRIVWELRLPRVLAAICVGVGLAQCGVVLQALTGNELADPYLLGISSGAATGAVSAIILGWSLPGLPETVRVASSAFVGALVALLVVLALATGRSGELPPARTILAGVAVGQLAGAATSLIVMVFGGRDGARAVLQWTLGSFAGVRSDHAIFLAALALVTVLVLTAAASTLDGFAFGETSARSLGIAVTRVRWSLLAGCALVTAGTVAVVGPIGFVGLTIPHIVRLITGPAHRILLPVSALAGGLLMLWSDTVARSAAPGQEIPVGIVTAAVGAPVLVVLLRRQARRS